MRLFPQPYQGLHPAFPCHEPPGCDSPVTHYLGDCGKLGVYSTAIGALLRGRPELGLTVAAVSSVAIAAVGFVDLRWQNKKATQYLKAKGIDVPTRRLADRWSKIDVDNLRIFGGLVGVGFAAARKRPWSITAFPRFVGSFAIGWYAAEVITPWHFLPGIQQAALVDAHRFPIPLNHAQDVQDKIGLSNFAFVRLRRGTTFAVYTKFLLPLLGLEMEEDVAPSMQNPGMNLDSSELGETPDSVQERPHVAYRAFGGTYYKPLRADKYVLTRHDVPLLKDHLDEITETRQRLALEAERLWAIWSTYEQVMAARDWGKAPRGIGKKATGDAPLENLPAIPVHVYVGNKLMVSHSMLWEMVTQYDWLIADTKKMLLELDALDTGRSWQPPLSDAARSARLDFISRVVKAARVQQENERQEMKQLLPEIKRLKKEMEASLPPEVVKSPLGHNPLRAPLDTLDKFLWGYKDVQFSAVLTSRLTRILEGGMGLDAVDQLVKLTADLEKKYPKGASPGGSDENEDLD